MKLPGRVWIWIHRTQNRWHDLLAVCVGYCNDCPWRPDPYHGGGYTFWRCALKRGHYGEHRARNYTWDENGDTAYVPVPIGASMPEQPWDRKPTARRSQQGPGWRRLQREKRRAVRKAGRP